MKKTVTFLFILFLFPIVSAEQNLDTFSGTIKANRLKESIKVDGYLNEPVWSNGDGITKFTQRDPEEGGLPSQKTRVHIAYDDDAIYIGARMFDTSPDSIVARLGRKDEWVE